MPVTVYGIPNCDAVKKAIAHLKGNGTPFHFHDFRKHGLTAELVETWLKQVPLETLINRKGTTWRQLPEELRQQATSAENALSLVLAQPTLIKRPVIDRDGLITVGQTDV